MVPVRNDDRFVIIALLKALKWNSTLAGLTIEKKQSLTNSIFCCTWFFLNRLRCWDIWKKYHKLTYLALDPIYTWRTLSGVELNNNWTQQFFGSVTVALSLNYTRGKSFRICLFMRYLLRFKLVLLSKMNKS